MLDKLKVVLFQPRAIGLYMSEKLFKTILMLIGAIILVLIPATILVTSQDTITNSYATEVVNNIQSANISNVYIENNKLSSEQTYLINTSVFDILIGTQEHSYNTALTYVLHFAEDEITFSAANIKVYSMSYEQLTIKSLNFDLIEINDYVEVNKIISIFNQLYRDNKLFIHSFNMTVVVIDLVLTVISSALLMAVMTMFFGNLPKGSLPFKLRIKNTLNCQYIYLLTFLFSILFGQLYIQFIGNFLMVIYVIVSTNSIIIKKVKV